MFEAVLEAVLKALEFTEAEIAAALVAPGALRVSILGLLTSQPCYNEAESTATPIDRGERVELGLMVIEKFAAALKYAGQTVHDHPERQAETSAQLVKNLDGIIAKNGAAIESFLDAATLIEVAEMVLIYAARRFLCEDHMVLADAAMRITNERKHEHTVDPNEGNGADNGGPLLPFKPTIVS